MCQSTSYSDFYNTVQGYKILDNGAAEGALTQDALLLMAAQRIKADEIVVPDALGDCDETIRRARAFRHLAENNPQYNYMGVVQGKTIAEMLKCIAAFQALPYINVMAVPRHVNKEFKTQRYSFLEGMFQQQWVDSSIKWHCLGASKWVREVVALAELPIRSMDTCLPVAAGLAGVSIKDNTYVPRQENYFELDANPYQYRVIEDNVWTYFDWAGYSPLSSAPPSQV